MLSLSIIGIFLVGLIIRALIILGVIFFLATPFMLMALAMKGAETLYKHHKASNL
jgi:hypothetical protein